jgi:hypothetical protein
MTSARGVLLTASLLLAGCTSLSTPDTNTRTRLISGYAAVLATQDSDADQRLSTSELEAMLDRVFSMEPPTSDLHDWAIAYYAAQDTDSDGYLTLVEILKDPLSSFDCMDANRDDRLSDREVRAGVERCPPENPYGTIGFISEPRAK